ncbi:MAG: SDR family NAD(P)-dependent oxidoreductase, partial [Byssovorax sp.]
AARIFSDALARPIRYEPAGVLGYALHLQRRGLPWAQIAVQTILHVGLRFGQASVVDPTLASLLGRQGRTLSEYARDHVALWKRATRS